MKQILLFALMIMFASVTQAQVKVAGPVKVVGPVNVGGVAVSGPAFVQAGNNLATTGTTNAVTVSAVGAGHGLFVMTVGTANPASPTAAGETFVTFTGTTGCQNFGADAMQCYLASNTTGGETTVTCNLAGSAASICIVIEFTRPSQLATPNDAGGNTSTAGATSLAVSTSAGTTNANDIVIACYGGFAIGSNAVSIAGYTINANATNTSANGQAACGYNVVSSTGTQSATGTWTSSMRANGIIMAFKP